MIEIKDLDLDLFRELSEAFGPSGYEHRAVRVVNEKIAPYADKITSDKTGSLIFEKKGQSGAPVILIAGHVDEIGFIITSVHRSGFLTFHPVGHWSDQTLLGQRVNIITRKSKKLTGVICAVPDILAPQKQGLITKDQMFIDIGCSSKEEAENLGVRIGDPVVPLSRFELIKNDRIAMGKAFDDRVGVFMVMETIRLLKQLGIDHPNTIVGAATVQEEVGIRGARTTIATVKPDLAFAIDVDIATDVPGIPEAKSYASMGKGVSIIVYDGTMIPNIALRETTIDTAEEKGIPYQLSAVDKGGTDAGVFHLYGRGCPSLSLGVPCRNIHSHVGLLSLEDVVSGIRLLIELCQISDRERIEAFTNFTKC